ncbi:hypothetical protein [Desulfopila sp. IMCC35008]|uniref:hypothetical protein n=1 Tax=Desulfopila sp. IMCC35008 TaxID=2653858 RepID=UPI0013D25D6E|nr:hypothetical protein [Desulfopila sp. IMCC35008]
MGLILVPGLVLYVLISVITVVCAIVFAKKRKRNLLLWGGGAAFVMYNLLFWDWLPTVATHKYYCSSQAGFWVYKTVDEWKAENISTLEKQSLVNNITLNQSKHEGDMNNFTSTEYVTNRLKYVFKHNGPFILNRWRLEAKLIDINTNQVLAQYVDFSTSQERRKAGWSGWKFWLNAEKCISVSHQDEGNIKEMIYELGGDK